MKKIQILSMIAAGLFSLSLPLVAQQDAMQSAPAKTEQPAGSMGKDAMSKDSMSKNSMTKKDKKMQKKAAKKDAMKKDAMSKDAMSTDSMKQKPQ